MRIDYSEPKKSCSSPQPSQNRPRRESSGGMLAVVFITGFICLGIGFGSGWVLSHRYAKKGFKAAMEQQSLENSQQQAKYPATTPPVTAPVAPPSSATQQPQTAGSAVQPSPTGTGQPTADPPLSFYKTLPSGQKNNVMGSGINTKDDKPGKQRLQAAMPSNLSKPAAAQGDDAAPKPPVPTVPAKTAVRQDSGGLTVQVASYSLRSEAEAQRSKLASKGYNVSIVESNLGDKGTWFRVRVGRHLDPDAAKELASKLGKGAVAIPDKE